MKQSFQETYPEEIIFNIYTYHYKTVNISYSGITYPSDKFIHKNEMISDYLFEYIVSGSGETDSKNKKYKLSSGDFALTEINSTISFRSDPNNPYKRLFFCANGPLIEKLHSIYKFNSPIHTTHTDVECEFMQIIDSMRDNTYSEMLWNELIFQIMLKTSSVLSDVQVMKTQSIADLTNDYIQSNISTLNSLDDIAAYLHTSKSNIIHSYKQKFGISPYVSITKARMKEANNLISGTSMSISEIAKALNYNSTAHFIKMYKKYSRDNHTPLQYRNVFNKGYVPLVQNEQQK